LAERLRLSLRPSDLMMPMALRNERSSSLLLRASVRQHRSEHEADSGYGRQFKSCRLDLNPKTVLVSPGHAFSSFANVARFNGVQCLLGGGTDVGTRVAVHFLERRHCGDGLGAEEAQGARGSN